MIPLRIINQIRIFGKVLGPGASSREFLPGASCNIKEVYCVLNDLLAVESNNNIVTVKPENGTGQLPVGEYHARLWNIEREDDQGNRWAITAQIFDDQGQFEVTDGNQTKLDLGEPIIASVDARKSGSIYSFNQIIKGRLDEHIELSRNGARPRAPKLNIKNKDGTYDRTFSFEYG